MDHRAERRASPPLPLHGGDCSMARLGMFRRWWIVALVAPLLAPALFASATIAATAQAPFHLIDATIDSIHTELRSGHLSCVGLVQAYINRINAYDQSGPKLNAIQNINPHALEQAAHVDAQLKAGTED